MTNITGNYVKMVDVLLIGLQDRHTKYYCFICEWTAGTEVNITSREIGH